MLVFRSTFRTMPPSPWLGASHLLPWLKRELNDQALRALLSTSRRRFAR